jgi:hypothetical protein
MHISYAEFGSLVLDIDGPRIDVSFIEDTPVAGDRFTILKEADGFELTGTSAGGGSVDPSRAFFETGVVATVRAVPESYHLFDAWGGDVSGSLNPTSVVMDADYAVTASFTLPLATNDIPVLWLLEHGHGTNAVDVLSDTDLDGVNASDEYHSGTIPTNAASVIRIEGLEHVGSNLVIRWQSAPNQLYDLLSAESPDGLYNPVATGLPAIPAEFTQTGIDTNDLAPQGYYLLKTYR